WNEKENRVRHPIRTNRRNPVATRLHHQRKRARSCGARHPLRTRQLRRRHHPVHKPRNHRGDTMTIEYAIGDGHTYYRALTLTDAINAAATDKTRWRIYERTVGRWEEVE